MHGFHGGGYPVSVYPWDPYYYTPYTYLPVAVPYPVYQPYWYNPEACPRPLSRQCTRLQVTGRWAASCFLPRFRHLRRIYGNDATALASAIAREEAPDCPFPTQTGAASEYERRVALAVAVLLNGEGIPVAYPPPPPTPRPPNADAIRQPWMRALLTGWV